MFAQIEITMDSPKECTEEQFREWLQYKLGFAAEMKISNPLVDEDLEFQNADSLKIEIFNS